MFDEALGRRIRKFRQKAGDNVAACARSAGEMERLDGSFRGLVRGEAGPVVTAVIA